MCMCMHACICVHAHVYTHVFVHACMCAFVLKHTYKICNTDSNLSYVSSWKNLKYTLDLDKYYGKNNISYDIPYKNAVYFNLI
jgi:hypothetical protein